MTSFFSPLPFSRHRQSCLCPRNNKVRSRCLARTVTSFFLQLPCRFFSRGTAPRTHAGSSTCRAGHAKQHHRATQQNQPNAFLRFLGSHTPSPNQLAAQARMPVLLTSKDYKNEKPHRITIAP